MLDQLVESKNNQKENRIGFLLTTFVMVVGLLFSAVLWSLFAKDLGIGNDSLELSTLIAPININENVPPEPIQKQAKSEQNNQTKNSLPTRSDNIQQIKESPIAPDKISVVPNPQKERPDGYFLVSDNLGDRDFQSSSSANRGNENTGSGIGIKDTESSSIENSKKIEPPPAMKKPPVETTQRTIVKSGGVVNGQAKHLPKPIYSVAAKAVRAIGAINVQVLIDEAGNVVSANAVNGHPLLKVEAEKAARNAKFNPTLLTGKPVKVSGIIIYKFSM